VTKVQKIQRNVMTSGFQSSEPPKLWIGRLVSVLCGAKCPKCKTLSSLYPTKKNSAESFICLSFRGRYLPELRRCFQVSQLVSGNLGMVCFVGPCCDLPIVRPFQHIGFYRRPARRIVCNRQRQRKLPLMALISFPVFANGGCY
jgi:hypothetical protein